MLAELHSGLRPMGDDDRLFALKGNGPKEEGDDGVVTYRSAHIDEVVSELVVRWDHSCQGQPEVIEEIRRILLQHVATPGNSRQGRGA